MRANAEQIHTCLLDCTTPAHPTHLLAKSPACKITCLRIHLLAKSPAFKFTRLLACTTPAHPTLLLPSDWLLMPTLQRSLVLKQGIVTVWLRGGKCKICTCGHLPEWGPRVLSGIPLKISRPTAVSMHDEVAL